MLRRRTALLFSVAVGVALQIGVWQATGAREAWDNPTYWTVGLPLAALAAACIGYLAVGTAWTATLLIVPAQVATMMVKNGEIGGLWPLSIALAFLMGLPFLLVAYVASRVRSRSR
jgi:ABC-type glycerol-3-phosphate transport system permease component